MPDDVVQLRRSEARNAVGRGWALTPLRGKQPIKKNWQAEPPASRSAVETWATKHNLGLRTGSISGVIVLDDDSVDGSAASELKLPETPVRTPA